jgi:peptide/nickel transport system permease protein
MTAVTVPGARWRAGHPMLWFLVRRLGRLVVSLLVLLTLSFAMIHLIPGDPVRAALGPNAPLDLIRQRRHELWLDRPLATQYVHYLRGVATGDFGTSFVSNLPVSDIIATRLPNSARLAGLAFVVIMVLAVPLGMAGAVLTRDGRRRGTELLFTSGTGLLAMVPDFLLGVGLVYVFGVTLKWFPVAGQAGPSSYVLPVCALTIGTIAALARIVRVEMIKVMGEDYIRTARSKRLPARLVYLRHALPNMLTATLTIGGLVLTGLIGGTVLVENVFSWPGLGTTVVDSVVQQDFALAQAVMVLLGAAVLLANLVVDLLLGVLDPRSVIREDR